MRGMLVRCGVLVLTVGGVVLVRGGEAEAVDPTTVATTKAGAGVGAGNPSGPNDTKQEDGGNSTLHAEASDSGPYGEGHAVVDITSTTTATKIEASSTSAVQTTWSGSATGTRPSAHVSGTEFSSETTLNESGYWEWSGTTTTTKSTGTGSNRCIKGRVSVLVYAPTGTSPIYQIIAWVTDCDVPTKSDSGGAQLAAGSRIKINATYFTDPSNSMPHDIDTAASFSVTVEKTAGPVSNTGQPHLTGTGVVGTQISTDNGTWNGSPNSFTYQWKSGGSNVSGENGSTYVVRAADVGKVIQCYVTASNGTSSSSQFSNSVVGKEVGTPTTSTPTPTPTATATPTAPAPTPLTSTAAPTVSGKAVVGKKLKATPGQWSLVVTDTGFLWLRNGSPIAGATNPTYKLTNKDKGKKVSVQVTATAAGSQPATATSQTVKVKPKPKPKK